MMKEILYLPLLVLFISCNGSGRRSESVKVPGLRDEVEVIRDEVGINHIYAGNLHDLFMAQGYCAARDRLFQFEIWRRQATGTVAEILGPRELKRDIGTRLFMFRGDMQEEMRHYHPEGEVIITAYVEGINTYIREVREKPELLPVTFKVLNIEPREWTPEVVISRHQGLLGNIGTELGIGRAVALLGPERVKEYYWFHPRDPDITLDPSLDGERLFDDILELYNSYRSPVKFLPGDILPEYRHEEAILTTVNHASPQDIREPLFAGSNNWVVSPSLTADGHAYMANDPHRRLGIPSLRYMVHLSAPGWNVIGGGEPEIPGVSIGHNDHGAWGLTVFRTDGEDLYVYDLNRENLSQYRYRDGWEEMTVIRETIPVKNHADVTVDLHYTRHGPVAYIDSVNLIAYAVRCAWMEPGGSPYLASLRMNQAMNWEEFREACSYSNIPGENMVWADRQGNIGWQAVGIAPIRRNFSGLVPVPGDGRYEWDGYLPIPDKPNIYNPEEGFFATANQHVIPESYAHWDAIAYRWADPFRGDRINEVLGAGKRLTMEDMLALQTDYLSIPARILVPMLENLQLHDSLARKAQSTLLSWDYILDKASVQAGIYVAWERELQARMFEYLPDPEAAFIIGSVQLATLIRWIREPDSRFGQPPSVGRDHYLAGTFTSAVQGLYRKFGEDMTAWKYGQTAYKHVQMDHPLGKVVNKELRERLNTAALPRGGNQYTPGSTSGADNQATGATFRIIVDLQDWDASKVMNSPGQSGDPESPFYQNLFEPWARDEYLPLYFSRDKIRSVAVEKIKLIPENGNKQNL